jgi:hypothetical protein
MTSQRSASLNALRMSRLPVASADQRTKSAIGAACAESVLSRIVIDQGRGCRDGTGGGAAVSRPLDDRRRAGGIGLRVARFGLD